MSIRQLLPGIPETNIDQSDANAAGEWFAVPAEGRFDIEWAVEVLVGTYAADFDVRLEGAMFLPSADGKQLDQVVDPLGDLHRTVVAEAPRFVRTRKVAGTTADNAVIRTRIAATLSK